MIVTVYPNNDVTETTLLGGKYRTRTFKLSDPRYTAYNIPSDRNGNMERAERRRAPGVRMLIFPNHPLPKLNKAGWNRIAQLRRRDENKDSRPLTQAEREELAGLEARMKRVG